MKAAKDAMQQILLLLENFKDHSLPSFAFSLRVKVDLEGEINTESWSSVHSVTDIFCQFEFVFGETWATHSN